MKRVRKIATVMTLGPTLLVLVAGIAPAVAATDEENFNKKVGKLAIGVPDPLLLDDLAAALPRAKAFCVCKDFPDRTGILVSQAVLHQAPRSRCVTPTFVGNGALGNGLICSDWVPLTK